MPDLIGAPSSKGGRFKKKAVVAEAANGRSADDEGSRSNGASPAATPTKRKLDTTPETSPAKRVKTEQGSAQQKQVSFNEDSANFSGLFSG